MYSPEPLSPTRESLANALSLGFPTGYFVIRSIATGKLLDVSGGLVEDGTEIVLWEEKDKSLVQEFRREAADNQVFFIDNHGALCSIASGHAIDVEDGKLVLRHRRPIFFPYPNSFSHSLPSFTYSPETGHIHVLFEDDPTYPGTRSRSDAWRHQEYLLTSVPLPRPPSLFESATKLVTSTASVLATPFGGAGPSSAGNYDLQDGEIIEEERNEDLESDDSAEIGRRVKVIALPIGWHQQKSPPGSKARDRRRWEVVPLIPRKAKTSTGGISTLTRP
jgi:hypothetical protein